MGMMPSLSNGKALRLHVQVVTYIRIYIGIYTCILQTNYCVFWLTFWYTCYISLPVLPAA